MGTCAPHYARELRKDHLPCVQCRHQVRDLKTTPGHEVCIQLGTLHKTWGETLRSVPYVDKLGYYAGMRITFQACRLLRPHVLHKCR